MTTIGTFANDGDSYTGTINTLALKAKAAIKPNSKTAEHAPDYRIFAAGAEIGAAWSRVSEAGKPYLSIKLDDPSFATAIFCRLIGREDGSHLPSLVAVAKEGRHKPPFLSKRSVETR